MSQEVEARKETTAYSSKNYIAKKLLSIVTTITVEPTFFLTLCTSMMYQVITQNLYLEKACRVDIGFNESICDAMTNRNTSGYTPTQEKDVQKLVSQMFAVRTTIQGFFPVCLILFVGSWTDRHCRRKPAILFPIIGEILCCMLLIINVMFFYELPIIFTTLGDCLILALSGGWPCLFLGIYSYLAANSSVESRTVRVGVATACQLSGLVFGVGISGFIFEKIGFLNFYILCIFTLCTALIFGIFLIKEERPKTFNVRKKGFLKDFFEIKNITSAVKVCFKKESTNRRKKLIFLLMISASTVGPMYGENNVSYLYTRYKFRWDYIQYGTFFSGQALLQVLGAIFSIVVFAKIFHFSDALLGIIALSGSTASSIVYALAPNGQIFSIGAICDTFYVTSHVAVRSLASKLIPPNELGQVNSIFGVQEALMPLIFGPFYSMMYKSTIDFFPSTYYFFSATVKFIGFLSFVWLFLRAIPSRNSKSETEEFNHQLEQKI